MWSQLQKWLVAGIASLGLSSTTVVFGQVSEQGVPSNASPSQATSQPIPRVVQPTGVYPRGGAAFPQGKQPLGGVGTSASAQNGSLATPYGVINQGAPAYVPGPSGQFGAPGAGIYGLVPGQPGQALPGTVPGALAPGEYGPGTGTGGTGMGAAGGGAGALGGPPGGAPMAGPGAAAAAPGLPEGVLAGLGGEVGAGAAAFAPPGMIGDMSPFGSHALQVGPPGPPPPPGARGASPIYPSVRNFKISENMSPRPQDRIFFNFNYYNGLNNTINLKDLSPITRMKAYIYNFGVEKTFNNGMGSIGLRLPLDNLTADSFENVISTPTSTSLGNLTIFGKYILAQNPRTGSLISALFAITPPTGPGRFAGAQYVFPLNSTYFQPAIGYIYNYNRWYLQGFSGFTFSANPNDVSIVYNDIAIGYFLIRNNDPHAFLTALAPTFELHVENPINHRDVYNRSDLAGSPDSVNLTYGLNLGIRNTAVLTAAFVTPLASPKPFDSEAILMLNIYYGRTRANIVQQMPPPL